VGIALSSTLLLIIALSMLVTTLLFIIYDQLGKRLSDTNHEAADDVDTQGTVIIAGIGRFGQIVNRLVQSAGFSTVAIDNDLRTVQMMRKLGFRGFFGDPTRPDLLNAAGLDEARILVTAIDDRASAVKLVTFVRKARPDIHIIARAHDRVHVYELYAAGANDIIRETFDGSLRAGRYALENLGLSEFEAAEATQMFYDHDRATVRELAELWKPGVALADNPTYVARAKELNNDPETALAARTPKGDN
jgi:CPA2 family monovalent cation:H+ antiporter-2